MPGQEEDVLEGGEALDRGGIQEVAGDGLDARAPRGPRATSGDGEARHGGDAPGTSGRVRGPPHPARQGGPILPPAPRTTTSPSRPAMKATSAALGRESSSSSCSSLSTAAGRSGEGAWLAGMVPSRHGGAAGGGPEEETKRRVAPAVTRGPRSVRRG